MNRRLTNGIRYVMDELTPAFIRNSRYFMFPFYVFAYRGRNIKTVMQFKNLVQTFSEEEYEAFYNNLNSISRNRPTDLNQASIDFILNQIDSDTKTLIDIGCGNGFLLRKINSEFPAIELTGFDIKKQVGNEQYQYVHGMIENLPFEDNSFDVVICSHTIEHLRKLDTCISELVRITKKQLVIVTPCQRYFYYTLDEHLNFFPKENDLTSLFTFDVFECKKLQGDWVYAARKT